jgi:transposase
MVDRASMVFPEGSRLLAGEVLVHGELVNVRFTRGPDHGHRRPDATSNLTFGSADTGVVYSLYTDCNGDALPDANYLGQCVIGYNHGAQSVTPSTYYIEFSSGTGAGTYTLTVSG